MNVARELKLVTYIAGIYFFYMIYAVVQEKITKADYGENGDRYTFTFFTLLIQCSVGALCAFIGRLIYFKTNDNTPQYKFAAIAVLYLTAMFASNAALVYVNYPTQVLAKSCKPIPVMLVGFLFLRKKYKISDWFFVALIVLGISMFLLKDKTVTKDVSDFQYMMGVGLLLLSLACDGFTGPLQESIFRSSKPSPIRMMMLNNFYAAILCFVAAFGITSHGTDAILFCQKYPEVGGYLVLQSIFAGLGQICIFLLVSQFGALPCSITTTTRKFFTILFSVLYYGNELSTRKWMGVALVFSGLFLHVASGYLNRAPKVNELEMKKKK